MINLQIDVVQKDSQGNLVTVQKVNLQSATSTLKLNPQAVLAASPELAAKTVRIYGIQVNIDCSKAVLYVEGFQYFSLSAFLNREPTLALLHVAGAVDYFKLNNLTIKRLDVRESNMLLAGCTVADLNVGLSTIYQLQKEGKTIEGLTPLKTDVRNSAVQQMRLYVPHSMVHLQGSTVQRLSLEKDSRKTDQVEIRDNSTVERLLLSGSVGALKIKHAKIGHLEFYPETKAATLEMKAAFVNMAHNCLPDTIQAKSIDTWKLVMDSARTENNPSLFASAGFQYMRYERKQLSSRLHRAAYRFIEWSCGYGFRPSYTVFMSALVCLLSGLGFWFLTVSADAGIRVPDAQNLSSVELMGYSMYYSVVTFTTVGYGDISPVGPLARALACGEALAGVSLSSLFVFALTKRYGGLR